MLCCEVPQYIRVKGFLFIMTLTKLSMILEFFFQYDFVNKRGFKSKKLEY